MRNKYESIFENITNDEFEQILKECGFNYEKVEEGKGGLFIAGERVYSSELRNEYENLVKETSELYVKSNFYDNTKKSDYFSYFDVLEESEGLVA